MKCYECGQKMKETKPARYHFAELGLPNVHLKGITVRVCPDCGEQVVNIPDPAGLQRAIMLMLVRKEQPLTRHEFRFLRKYLGWSSSHLALKMRTTRETISRWENGGTSISGYADELMRRMALLEKPDHDYSVTKIHEILEARQKYGRLTGMYANSWDIKAARG